MNLDDPTQIGLILVITGILGLAGGNLKAGVLEVSLATTKGRFSLLVMLTVLVGLGLMVFDYIYYLEPHGG